MNKKNYNEMFETEIENNIPQGKLICLWTLWDDVKPKLYNKLKKQDKKKLRKTIRNHFNWCKYLSYEKRVDGKNYYIKLVNFRLFHGIKF